MKKHEEIEMKIYELLGVKYFKKLAISLVDITFLPFTLKAYKGLSLKERVFKINHVKSNYFIGKINSMEDVENFKHSIIINSRIHIFALAVLFALPHKVLINTILFNIIFTILNCYCLMLQRYNWIRINETVRKMTPRYERQKAKIIDELQETEKKLPEPSYKIIDKEDKEKDISFEELISNASMEELKRYQHCLLFLKHESDRIKKSIDCHEEPNIKLTAPFSKEKTLKLEIGSRRSNEKDNN